MKLPVTHCSPCWICNRTTHGLDAQAPLRGITPIIDFIADAYGNRYAPNTRETIRDDAVKYFVEEVSGAALLPTNPIGQPTAVGPCIRSSPTALDLLRKVGSPAWTGALKEYLASREELKHEITRKAQPGPCACYSGRWLTGRAFSRRPEPAHQIRHRTFLSRVRTRWHCALHRRHRKQVRPPRNRRVIRSRRHFGLRRQDSRRHCPRYKATNWLLLIEAVTKRRTRGWQAP